MISRRRSIRKFLPQSVEAVSYTHLHVSGHACQDEQKLMMALTRPKFFIPVHGEYKHLKKHAETALSMGIPRDHIILPELGKIIELDGVDAKIAGTVPAGKVMVDGLGVGDVAVSYTHLPRRLLIKRCGKNP